MNTQSQAQPYQFSITNDDLFEVRRRRMLAFIADYFVVAVLSVIAGLVVGVMGIVTFGVAWLLYGILVPAVALLYVGSTMGGPLNATPGMRLFGIRVETLDGKNFDWLMAVVHAILFWGIHVVFTPFALLASLFSGKKRLIHDFLLGTVFVRDGE